MTEEAEKKQKKRKRNISVSVRMSPEEKVQFDKKVFKSGLTQSEFFIKTALQKDIKVVGSVEQLDRLIFEINKIGVNLNQIAKRMNEGNFFNAGEELDELKKRYEKSLDVMIELLDQVKGD